MTRLLELLLTLGNNGAVHNAGALAHERRREDWIVDSLERAVARAAPVASSTTKAA